MSMLASFIVPFLLGFLATSSRLTLPTILSFITSSWLLCAAVPVGLLFWRRITGSIKDEFPRSPRYGSPVSVRGGRFGVGAQATKTVRFQIRPADEIQLSQDVLVWGPWRVPEPYGTIVNLFGLAWIVTALFFSFWPRTVHVNAKTMNFSCLMTVFWIILGSVYYAVKGKRVGKSSVLRNEIADSPRHTRLAREMQRHELN